MRRGFSSAPLMLFRAVSFFSGKGLLSAYYEPGTVVYP